jgi:endonuclease YncB( thermonuclease family)
MKYEIDSLHTFTITRFRDGDTVEGYLRCRCCGESHQDTVRLLKIESWEIASPDKNKALKTAETLTGIYRGQSGNLVPANIRRDKYHRILADIYFGDSALTVQLVTAGFAWWGVGEPPPGPGSLASVT